MRIVVGIASVLCIAAGFAVIAFGGRAALNGVWLVGLGAAGIVAVAFERSRYRSEQAEPDGLEPGIGGIDDGLPDARFQPTNERFVDPTTGQRVRVWLDPASGERRYRLDE